jgi:hypothetical protein
MNQHFDLLQVGQYVPGCRTHARFVRADHRDGMWRVFVGIPSMTQEELTGLCGGRVRLAAARFDENLFFLLRFGDLPWLCAPFEPRVCADREALREPAMGGGATMAFVFIDSETGVAQAKRVVNLDADADDQLLRLCGELLALPYNRAACLQRQAELLRRYPTGEDMLQAADPAVFCAEDVTESGSPDAACCTQ